VDSTGLCRTHYKFGTNLAESGQSSRTMWRREKYCTRYSSSLGLLSMRSSSLSDTFSLPITSSLFYFCAFLAASVAFCFSWVLALLSPWLTCNAAAKVLWWAFRSSYRGLGFVRCRVRALRRSVALCRACRLITKTLLLAWSINVSVHNIVCRSCTWGRSFVGKQFAVWQSCCTEQMNWISWTHS